MPNVVVYLRAEDSRNLESAGLNPAEWVRSLVRGALERGLAGTEVGRGDAREYAGSTSVKQAPAASVPASPAFRPAQTKPEKVVKCELRNPAVPSQKCGLELGHAGDHVFA